MATRKKTALEEQIEADGVAIENLWRLGERSRNARACLDALIESCALVQNENGKPTALMHRDHVRSMLERVRNALDGSEPW